MTMIKCNNHYETYHKRPKMYTVLIEANRETTQVTLVAKLRQSYLKILNIKRTKQYNNIWLSENHILAFVTSIERIFQFHILNDDAIVYLLSELQCPVLPPKIKPIHMTCTDRNYYRSTCRFSCDPGYDITPGQTRVMLCTENGLWRGAVPTCKGTKYFYNY